MLIIGLFLLIVGADLLVKGSSSIAKKFHIPEILIGLTIVAIGTSMPELIITISSARQGATDLIIGNAIGSNLCNLLLIMSMMALFIPVKIDQDLVTGNLIGSCILNSFLIIGVGAIITPLSFASEFINNLILLTCAIILIWLFCFIGKKNTLTRYKALPLLTLFITYMIKLFR